MMEKQLKHNIYIKKKKNYHLPAMLEVLNLQT